jgi:uncharacterized membrane protein SpoIIM required for sporulation
MHIPEAIDAIFYIYVLFFAASVIAMLIGLRMAYVAWTEKNNDLMRKAKFVLLFAVIAIVCIAIVSFFETGKLPIN